jgi:Zc3h12a-like Ribonuclease NYN domain
VRNVRSESRSSVKEQRPARPDGVRRGRRKETPNANQPAKAGPRPESERVIIDASNVAHSTEKNAPRLANVRLVRDRLTEDGLTPILVADAALRHQIDDPDGYEGLVKAGEIQQAPAGTDADYFILSFARELSASVLSNDRFKDRIAQFPEVKNRIIRYMIVAGEVVLERRTKRRGR